MFRNHVVLLISATIFCWNLSAMEFPGFDELSVSSLSCDIEGLPTMTRMEYLEEWGEMQFYLGEKALSGHWDAFYFFQDQITKRVWIVYHDGGAPDLVAGDAYIDPDGSGLLLAGDAEGGRLQRCHIVSEMVLKK